LFAGNELYIHNETKNSALLRCVKRSLTLQENLTCVDIARQA